jgi:hypothetical protein
VEAAGNAIRLGIAGFAGALGAFAAPIGMVCLGLVRGGGYWAALRRHYAGPAVAGEPVHVELRSER